MYWNSTTGGAPVYFELWRSKQAAEKCTSLRAPQAGGGFPHKLNLFGWCHYEKICLSPSLPLFHSSTHQLTEPLTYSLTDSLAHSLTVKYVSTLVAANLLAPPTAAASASDRSISPSTANCLTIAAKRRCKKPRATRLSPSVVHREDRKGRHNVESKQKRILVRWLSWLLVIGLSDERQLFHIRGRNQLSTK